MIYLLDTNAISALMRAGARLASWLSSIGADDRVVICSITRGEILFGWRGWLRGDAEPNSKKKLGSFSPYFDLWIAATALAMNATLVSRDSDFQRIEGLAVVEP